MLIWKLTTTCLRNVCVLYSSLCSHCVSTGNVVHLHIKYIPPVYNSNQMIMIMNGFWKITGTKQTKINRTGPKHINIENYQYNGIPIAIATHDTYTALDIIIPKEKLIQICFLYLARHFDNVTLWPFIFQYKQNMYVPVATQHTLTLFSFTPSP